MAESTAPSATARFVETMGLLWETEGLPRIAGRIFGFLLLQAEPCSLDDMAAALSVSKASVSTDARRLETIGLISRVGRPGDRRDYYAIADDASARALEFRLERMRRFATVFDGLLDRSDQHPTVRDRLEHLEACHERVVRHMETLLAELRQGAVSATPDTPLPSR